MDRNIFIKQRFVYYVAHGSVSARYDNEPSRGLQIAAV